MQHLKTELQRKQKLNIDRRFIQSIDVLQMTDAELAEYLVLEAEENPILDMDALYAEDSPLKFREKAEWLHEQRQKDYTPRSAEDKERDESLPGELSENVHDSLKWHLLSQLTPCELSGDKIKIFAFLIECVDERGYMDISPMEAARLLQLDTSEVENCMSRLRSLQPTGICAKDLRECLLLQLKQFPEEKLARLIVETQLEAFARGWHSQIAKALDSDLAAVYAACEKIRELSPMPLSALPANAPTEYLLPDAFIICKDGNLEVSTSRTFIPCLIVSPYYMSLYRQSDDEQLKEYLDGKLKSARNLIRNVAQREVTFKNVLDAIADIQKEYFTERDAPLLPMTLDDVAEHIGIHSSTVSRAVKNKYIQSSRGIIELKKLFSRHLESHGADNHSANHAKKLIAEFVEAEEKTSPLSDQRISEMLAVKGILISRRTVAKYREQLGIPSTLHRKKKHKT